ncbi:protein C-mannosyl-transferase DPY19L1 [Vanessa tameamea]|uniref:Protein C-mannosyl-transferase DPY19L1 n=1 Tax=Vanessa tameamea TaxID=334116 RepID=A0A8B8HWY7_VANTA|nr:probable C-mannosyltransferase DPY19L1 [Vanessa tameamea]
MEASPGEVQDDSKDRKSFGRKLLIFTLLSGLAYSLGYIHYKYVSHLFENDRNFLYLSDLEREMSFRTEMGFYYSYYKTVVEEKPLLAGMYKIIFDKLVEYPKDVNTINRFNIIPEVIIGAMYRYFEPWLNSTQYRECHMVERGPGHSPVESCVGIGQPVFFYLEVIWWLSGLTVAALFLHATMLSQSVLGGLLAVVQYFTNHAECTRVQWAPNERENLAAPLLLLQAWLLTLQLRETSNNRILKLEILTLLINILCLLFWQFTQFIFLSQLVIFFVMEQLKIIDVKTFALILYSHFCSLHTAVLLLQGNDMLKCSLYTTFLITISMYCLFLSYLRIKVQSHLDLFVETWLVILRVSLVLCLSWYLKKLFSEYLQVEEDSHVWDILYSKFTDYKTFHTLIYTCSEVFDFLKISSLVNMMRSLLIPLVLVSCVNVTCHWRRSATERCAKETEDAAERDRKQGHKNDDEDSGIENNTDIVPKKEPTKIYPLLLYLRNLQVESAIFYNISQMIVYGVMAVLVMRLKLLFSTHMCLVSSLIFNKKYYTLPKSFSKYVPIMWAIIIVPILTELSKNITKEMSHIGEFNDYPQEELLLWISKEAGAGAFAGSMPISATIMLSTRRPIVTHPHYEHLEARQRAYSVYKMYGKFSLNDLYVELNKYRATYLIVETKYCYGRSKKRCSFEDIWDVEAPALKSNPKLCHTLLTEPVDHFYPVFRNEHYAVFRIHDFSVRYMPRTFDT